jgi:heme-degrading monooxygenase HmoA
MTNPVLELVIFKLNPGVSDEVFISALEATTKDLERQPGFIRREARKDPDGTWVDLVYWQSRDQALEAMNASQGFTSMAAFAAAADFQNAQMLHLDWCSNG